jgi:hypothetical protein
MRSLVAASWGEVAGLGVKASATETTPKIAAAKIDLIIPNPFGFGGKTRLSVLVSCRRRSRFHGESPAFRAPGTSASDFAYWTL